MATPLPHIPCAIALPCPSLLPSLSSHCALPTALCLLWTCSTPADGIYLNLYWVRIFVPYSYGLVLGTDFRIGFVPGSYWVPIFVPGWYSVRIFVPNSYRVGTGYIFSYRIRTGFVRGTNFRIRYVPSWYWVRIFVPK